MGRFSVAPEQRSNPMEGTRSFGGVSSKDGREIEYKFQKKITEIEFI